ncbi:lamin tail domain-containing protein [Chitinophaga tropicalis]|uniref:LTD domain-containing protein n=1 Tax=Chitinophaga tropicalis TaxID=2683588 RepID=A0A7K1TXW1_9BACT|nr:lamin tail domain-containing protein [Chitinophaga tropicalis]MVT06939.1 hypothetical protein [Chitinophaga tropicalis]
MRFSIVCAYLLLRVSFSFSQFVERFDYQQIGPDFPWQGTDTAWQLNSGQLQSSLRRVNSSFYIATPLALTGSITWEWWIWLNFNTSSQNYVDVYLMADTSNLLSEVKGYYVRIGNTRDEICLYRRDGTGTPSLLVDGRDGITDHSSNILKIRVIRSATGQWELWTDETGKGDAYVSEGGVTDNIYNTSRFMGFLVRQSTSSFFRRHYIDDVIVWTEATPPDTVQTVPVKKYDVLIHEFLPRALPSAGLLPARFIELRNNSEHAIQLKGWKIGNSTREVVLPAYLLKPDSLLVLCDKGSASAYSINNILGISGMPLPGDSDVITLYNDSNVLVHAVGYDRSWYNDAVKAKGGWSLEMRSVQWPCAGGSNWQPSAAPGGGTPGTDNTANGIPLPVSLQRSYMYDSVTVQLIFSGAMDSLTAVDIARYSLPLEGISISPPLYNTVILHLQRPLSPDTIYMLSVDGLNDCKGLPVKADSILLTQSAVPDSLDVVINEVLYDGAIEFIELYNRSKRSINLQELYVNGKTVTIPALLLPGELAVFTSDPAGLCMLYNCMTDANIYDVNIPVLKNGEGDVVLKRSDGQVLDSFHYSDDLHFLLAGNTKGVSLERLDPDAPTQDKYNWHSAASTVKYSTPGTNNSQRLQLPGTEGVFSVAPSLFSPDNDGTDDVAVVSYTLPGPGYVANMMIFDALGRLVRTLEKNILLPVSGRIFWDGRGDGNRVPGTGIYVIFIEIFDLNGRTSRWKLPLVLAKRLN